jgi:hypothetical protein
MTCPAGFGNCDGDDANGCERSLRTLSDCGGCAVACGPLDHATASCAGGTCAVAGCDAGFDDCNGTAADGCEAGLTSLPACGACGSVCDLANASETCATGTCAIAVCSAGWDDCDGTDGNGCERSLTTLADCGACGAPCDIPDATETCATGTCRLASCIPLRGNCDGVETNGCEAALDTVARCGSCVTPCEPPHAVASCNAGLCTVSSCDPGYGDCDGAISNGCETRLGTDLACAACGDTCAAGDRGTGVVCR